MDTCRVCGTALNEKYGVCPYCGYSNRPFLTLDGDDSAEYRSALRSELTDFRVKTYRYHYQSGKNGLGTPKDHEYRFGDAGKLCGKLVWSGKDEWIAHPQEDAAEGTAEITYRIRGEQRTLSVPMKLTAREGVWRIALRLEEDFRLSVIVGTDMDHRAGEARAAALALR